MTYMMTGATGYIGSVLLRQLQEEGHTVHVLCRPRSVGKVDHSHPQIVLFRGDLLDDSSLERAMAGCDGVFHLAAYASVWAEDSSVFYRVNVDGTRNVLSAARKAGVPRVVYTSSAATIPASGGGEPVDESTSSSRSDTEYARSKYQAEAEVNLCHRKGLETVTVHPPRVYGPGPMRESNAVTRLINWYRQGWWRFVPGDGRMTGNYAYVEDVARGHRLAMTRGRSGEHYILGGENLTLRELLDLAGEATGRQHRLWGLPVPLLQAFTRLERWKAERFGRSPLITPEWLENYMKDSALSSQKAVEELGYEITPAKEGVKRTVRWLASDSGGRA